MSCTFPPVPRVAGGTDVPHEASSIQTQDRTGLFPLPHLHLYTSPYISTMSTFQLVYVPPVPPLARVLWQIPKASFVDLTLLSIMLKPHESHNHITIEPWQRSCRFLPVVAVRTTRPVSLGALHRCLVRVAILLICHSRNSISLTRASQKWSSFLWSVWGLLGI
jgi:hypothetical protein